MATDLGPILSSLRAAIIDNQITTPEDLDTILDILLEIFVRNLDGVRVVAYLKAGFAPTAPSDYLDIIADLTPSIARSIMIDVLRENNMLNPNAP